MSRLWSPEVERLSPYVPGEQPKLLDLIKLNTNENPYGPSPRVTAAIQAELGDNLRRYPDPNSDALRAAIARRCGLTPRHVFVGNGSDEVLAHAFLALLRHERPVLLPDISYSFYPVYCALYGIRHEQVPLDEHFRIRLDDYLRPNGGIVFANPNAPTGCALPVSEIETLLRANRDSVVLVDEAYVDFGAESAARLIERFDNLLVVQTLSKSRSLAGLRVGFALAQPELVDGLERVKNSFNSYPLDRAAQIGAIAAFADEEHFETTRQRIIATRERLSLGLAELGFEVLPSSANFVFARHPQHDARELAAGLRRAHIIVRHFGLARIEQFLRITIGTDAHTDALLRRLKELVVQSDLLAP